MLSTRVATRTLATVLVLCGMVSEACALEVDGFTEPYRDIDVAAADMGLVEQITVREGDRVRAGQLLASLDEDVAQSTLKIAQSVMESQGRLESAIAELELQAEMLTKLEELRSRKHASPQEVERARSQLRIAEARLKAVREEYEVKVLEHERARVQLERRRLTSPIDGIVIQIFKDRGEFVSPSDPVILRVVQLDPLLVVFSVPTARSRELEVGKTVDVRFDEFKSVVQGEVEFVSPTADPQSGTARVRVRIPNPEERLPSGAACRLLLSRGFKSARVPAR